MYHWYMTPDTSSKLYWQNDVPLNMLQLTQQLNAGLRLIKSLWVKERLIDYPHLLCKAVAFIVLFCKWMSGIVILYLACNQLVVSSFYYASIVANNTYMDSKIDWVPLSITLYFNCYFSLAFFKSWETLDCKVDWNHQMSFLQYLKNNNKNK